jgi:hypothetical protein
VAVGVIFAGATPGISGPIQRDVNFAELIRTPSDIQRTLERCDGHPEFETALANWLETAEPSLTADRQAVREASLRLLEDTTDRQLVLGLSDGLLRHAMEDIKRDPALDPEEVARALYADIRKAAAKQKSKATAVLVPALGLQEDGTVTNERQAIFLSGFLNRAEPRVAHRARPSPRGPEQSASGGREQGDRGAVARR